MNHGRNAACLAAWMCLALCAGAAVKSGAIRITVLDSQTRSVTLDDSGVPKNCDGVNYDAYCHSSKTAEITNMLLVQAGDRPPFWVSCTVETKWSRCTPLTKGESFNAKQEKRGISIYFLDDNGRVRQQLYTYAADEKGRAAEARAAAQIAPTQAQPAPVQAGPAESRVAAGGESVKCSFASTPTGAEISVDGKFVGSTPSVLSLSLGPHAVELSLTGFVPWKRDLTISAGSELTVSPILEKAQ